jgi:hypothetical protein
MFKKTLTAIAAVVGLTSVPAVAQVALPQAANSEVGKAVVADLAGELAQCWAFYDLGVTLAKRDWPDVDQSAGDKAAQSASQMAMALSSPDIALANFKIAVDDMTHTLAGDVHRLPIVVAKYGSKCKDLMEHPELRAKYWIDIENAGLTSATKR